jgi:hypothetical protein
MDSLALGQLDGRRICDSVEEANAYLMEPFKQVFPEDSARKSAEKNWSELLA